MRKQIVSSELNALFRLIAAEIILFTIIGWIASYGNKQIAWILCALSIPVIGRIFRHFGRTVLITSCASFAGWILIGVLSRGWYSIPFTMLSTIVGVMVASKLWGLADFWKSGHEKTDETREILFRSASVRSWILFVIIAPGICGLIGGVFGLFVHFLFFRISGLVDLEFSCRSLMTVGGVALLLFLICFFARNIAERKRLSEAVDWLVQSHNYQRAVDILDQNEFSKFGTSGFTFPLGSMGAKHIAYSNCYSVSRWLMGRAYAQEQDQCYEVSGLFPSLEPAKKALDCLNEALSTCSLSLAACILFERARLLVRIELFDESSRDQALVKRITEHANYDQSSRSADQDLFIVYYFTIDPKGVRTRTAEMPAFSIMNIKQRKSLADFSRFKQHNGIS